ncbi:prepilin-type N-terminal cleavage/methylation domain-containing protein [Candidatus Uhrbacteria bacterium]|nr:prepilin-type N-terminal cleavage/methylation domain-containing protein [Candidatus Uhrbacteria bacterium]
MHTPSFFKKKFVTCYMLHVTCPGFTLLELLISVSIFLIITVVALANFRTGEQMERLRFAAENMQQQIRELQTFARTGQQHSGQVPKGGYGLVLVPCAVSPCTLRPFADLNADRRATPNEYLSNPVLLREQVGIPEIRVDGILVSSFSVALIAQSPFGDLLVANAFGEPILGQEVRFKFKHFTINRTRTLILNLKSGQMRQE